MTYIRETVERLREIANNPDKVVSPCAEHCRRAADFIEAALARPEAEYHSTHKINKVDSEWYNLRCAQCGASDAGGRESNPYRPCSQAEAGCGQQAEVDEERPPDPTIDEYKAVVRSYRRLVHKIDVAWRGEKAAAENPITLCALINETDFQALATPSPAPQGVVRFLNVYDKGGTSALFNTREDAEANSSNDRVACLRITISANGLNVRPLIYTDPYDRFRTPEEIAQKSDVRREDNNIASLKNELHLEQSYGRAQVRREALEEVVEWHDAQEAASFARAQKHRDEGDHRAASLALYSAQIHAESADRIRALASAPAEGERS